MRRTDRVTARRALPEGRGPRLWKAVLALLLAVVVGSSGYGSWAYWQDSAEVSTGQLQAGTLDLVLDGDRAAGLGTGHVRTDIAWSGLVPGEQLAFLLSVRNIGDPPATYTATVGRGTTPPWSYVGSPVTVQLFEGARVPDTTYPRTESCGGSPVGNRAAVPANPVPVTAAGRRLAAGASETLCLVVGLDAATNNENQGRTGSLLLTLTAQQATG